MSNNVFFYTIAFETEQLCPTNRSVLSHFKKIEELLKTNTDSTIRYINGVKYRLSSFYWPDFNDDFVIIPIGKRKSNPPYVEGEDKKELKELDLDVYDVNIIGYDKNKKIMIMTSYKSAPSTVEVENYFNSYLLETEKARIRINPLYHNAAIEKIRRAPRVKSLILSLNLRASMVDLYKDHMVDSCNIKTFFQGFAKTAKEDVQGNKMKVEIAIGQGKKTETLDKDAILELIDSLNIDSSFIDEVEVKYVDGVTEKIDTAPLKNTKLHIMHHFSLSGNKMSGEFLKHNINAAIDEESKKIYSPKKAYFDRQVVTNPEYSFVTDWQAGAIVK